MDEGLLEIAAAIRESANDGTWMDPDHVVALGSLVVAVLSMVFTYMVQRRSNDLQRTALETASKTERTRLSLEAAGESANIALELRIKRLDEFYGRIQVHARLSLSLYNKLLSNGPKAKGWSYLMNAEAVHASPADRALMKEIIDVNRVINELISTRGGLIREPSGLFDRFQTHFRLVESTFMGTAVPEANSDDTYPAEFDAYIEAECAKLRKEVDEIDEALLHAKEVLRKNQVGTNGK